MDNTATEKYIKEMLDKNLFGVIFPKDKSEKSAQSMIDMIDAAVGMAEFKDDDGNITWGVLIDKRKIKDSLKLTEENKDDSNNM
jgi:hypothetical protein